MHTREPERTTPWVIVALAVALMIVNWADKSALGLVAVPLMADLGLSPEQFGLLGSAYFFTYSVSALLFGWIATRVRVNRILMVIVAAWTICMLPVALAPSFLILFLSRLLLGFTEAPATPLANFLVQSWFPDAKRSIPATLLMIGSPLGILLAGPGLSLVMITWGWHAVFVTLGLGGLVWCVFWYFLGREGPHSGRAPVADSGLSGMGLRGLAAAVVLLVRRPSWSLYTLLAFAAYWILTLSTTWMAAFFTKGLGYDTATTGNLLAVFPAIAIVTLLVWGVGSEAMQRRGVATRITRGVLPATTGAVAGLAIVLGAQSGDAATAVVLVALGAALVQPIFTLGFLLVAEVAPPHLRALSISLHVAVATLAGVLAPVVTGALVGAGEGASGYRAAFLLVGVMLLVTGLAGVLWIDPARDRAHREETESAAT